MYRRNNKTLVAKLCGALGVAVLVAACSSTAAPSPSSSPSSASAAASSGATASGSPSSAASTSGSATTATSAPAATGNVTLKIINWVNPAANQALKKINAEFEAANPGIKVQYVTAANTQTGYATLLQTSVSSTSADIITTNFPFQPLPPKPTTSNMTPEQLWATKGLLMPLDGQPWLSRYSKASLASETYNGKVYGIVSGAYQWMVFYNKAEFAKYHVTVPTTWTEFLNVLKTFKSHGVTPIWFGTGGGAQVYVQEFLATPLMASAWMAQGKTSNLAAALQTGRAKWTDPGFLDVLNKMKQLTPYFEPGFTGVSWQGMPGAFAAGKAPMLLDGSWDIASVHSANPTMSIGAFPLPGSDTAADNQGILSNDLTIEALAKSPHKAAILKWLAFFSQPNIYAQYVNITGISPTQTTGTFDNFTAKSLGAYLGKGVTSTDVFPVLSPSNGHYTQSQNNFADLLVQVMQGQTPASSAATTYQQSWKPAG